MGEFHQFYVSLGPQDDGAPDRVRAALAEVFRWGDPANAASADEYADAAVRAALAGEDDRLGMEFAMLGGENSCAYSMQDMRPPECPECTAEDPLEYIPEWYHTGVEPPLTCWNCGFTAPAGDWNGDTFPVISSCGIHLIDYGWIEGAEPELHQRLLALIGPRPRYRCGKL
ncbi:hypothetical protein [Tsukamurella spumae]|uniref:Uncharacterized protein n=1 Tax=Tsukamurella spumae TaxID=44753 RepID=A0A846WX37_9ACTN|nr:hypothetical protein [Tsukamurella spumae]NKY16835.1 hypothetical protein [Tsukamurella spumae]